ncbi:MAG TPA: SDR family oxidoreductase [Solirubrobacterales bacterium]
MKVVVIGGTGLIGSKVVICLEEEDNEAVAASPDSGVNTLTGKGLPEVLDGAEVVIDVSNSPSFEDKAVMDFFTTSTTNLLAAEADAGVRHHVALSIVGSERLDQSGYMRAKVAQEKLIGDSSIRFSIVHATQFYEFAKSIADDATDGDEVRLPHVLFQPMAADDVAAAVCEISQRAPADRVVEIGGPEEFHFDEFIQQFLTAKGDPRKVVPDPKARYFGAELEERSLVPESAEHLGEITFEDWLAQSANA